MSFQMYNFKCLNVIFRSKLSIFIIYFDISQKKIADQYSQLYMCVSYSFCVCFTSLFVHALTFYYCYKPKDLIPFRSILPQKCLFFPDGYTSDLNWLKTIKQHHPTDPLNNISEKCKSSLNEKQKVGHYKYRAMLRSTLTLIF